MPDVKLFVKGLKIIDNLVVFPTNLLHNLRDRPREYSCTDN